MNIWNLIEIAHHYVPHPSPSRRSYIFYHVGSGSAGSSKWTSADTALAICLVATILVIAVFCYFIFRSEPLAAGKFKCSKCGGVFDLGDDEKAKAELKGRFGDLPPEQCDMVCDRCYEQRR